MDVIDVVMEKHGVTDVNFAGFIVDNAQANFNVVREVFGSGEKTQPMLGRERTCQFHWSQTLERHTKQLIKPELQEVHRRLCHEYRLCKTKAHANATMEAICTWWFSSGVVSEGGLKELND